MIDPNNKDMPRWARERLEAEMGMGVAETSASPFLIVIVLGAVAWSTVGSGTSPAPRREQ